jgi:hypothetical protein
MCRLFRSSLGLVAMSLMAGSCATAVPTGDPGIRLSGEHSLLAEGPELRVALGFGYAGANLGADTLILGLSFAGSPGVDRTAVDRAQISVQTPDRRRIFLMSRIDYRQRFARLHGAVRQASMSSPTLVGTGQARRPCGEWFFADPVTELARDIVLVSPFEACDGELLFEIPGGVQPGRWELEIRLEESVVEIPFTLDAR